MNARLREKQLKTGFGRAYLKRRLEYSRTAPASLREALRAGVRTLHRAGALSLSRLPFLFHKFFMDTLEFDSNLFHGSVWTNRWNANAVDAGAADVGQAEEVVAAFVSNGEFTG